MLEPAARSLADGHGDAPTTQSDGKVGGVADPAEIGGSSSIVLREDGENVVLHLDTTLPFEAWKEMVMAHFGSHPEAVLRCRERSLHFDVGTGRVERFDLRRMAHVFADEYEIEVSALRCTNAALLTYTESELKMRVIPHPETTTEIESDEVDEDVYNGASSPIAADDSGAPELDPVEFVEDEDSLGLGPAVTPRYEETDLDPVTPVLVVEEGDESWTSDLPPAPESEEALPRVESSQDPVQDPETGPSLSSWVSRPLVREDQDYSGQRQFMAVQKTLRSGSRISFAGDVIVYGDVNAGAEIEAEGNIIVLGAIRGSVHAGRRGETGAFVLALDLRPTHLSVAGRRARLDSEPITEDLGGLQSLLKRGRPVTPSFEPAIAHIREDEVVCEPYQGRLPVS